MADLSWAALDCAKAICDSGIDIAKTRLPEIAEGMVEGCINVIYNTANMIIHPRETIHNIRESFSHLGKCLVTLAVSVDHPEDLFISPETNEIKVELRQEIMENIIDATSQMTFKGTVSLVTEQYVSGKIFCLGMSCLKHYADPSLAQLAKIGQAFNDKTGDRVPKLVNVVRQKIADKFGNNVAVTAEGFKVTVNNTQKETKVLQSMDKVGETSKKISGAILKDSYYEVNGFKFTEYYYDRLWSNGRNCPGFRAESILRGASTIVPDPQGYEGFFKYICNDWEMIFNPTTKVVSHLSKIKKKSI